MIIKIVHDDIYSSKLVFKLRAYFQNDAKFPDKACTVFLLQDDFDILNQPLYKLGPLSTPENIGRFEFIKGYLKALGYDPWTEMDKLCTEVRQVYKNDGFVIQKEFNWVLKPVLDDSGANQPQNTEESHTDNSGEKFQ